MPNYSVWALGASNITVSGGKSLSGVTQGDGTHLVGETIRLDSRAWQETRLGDNDTTFDDNDGNQVLRGTQSFDGTSYANNTVVEGEYRLTLRDEATGEEWDVIGYNVNEPGQSPAYGTVEGLAFVGDPGAFPPTGVDLRVVGAFEGPGFAGEPTIEAGDLVSPICFAAGTRIATPDGEVPVEMLRPGDPVLTAAGQARPVRLCLSRCVRPEAFAQEPRLRPVRIEAGALGGGLPHRTLRVSRQHRMLVTSPIVRRMFGTSEVLIPAVRLLGLPGIRSETPAGALTYVHLVLDRHEVILAEGAPSETLLLGPEAARRLEPAALREIELVFPGVTVTRLCEPARPIPAGHRQRGLVRRHRRNGMALTGPSA
jgi:hypothetical protein